MGLFDDIADKLEEGFDAVDALFGIDSRAASKAKQAPTAVRVTAPQPQPLIPVARRLAPVPARIPVVIDVPVSATCAPKPSDVTPAERLRGG